MKTWAEAFWPSDVRLKHQAWFTVTSRTVFHQVAEVGMPSVELSPSWVKWLNSRINQDPRRHEMLREKTKPLLSLILNPVIQGGKYHSHFLCSWYVDMLFYGEVSWSSSSSSIFMMRGLAIPWTHQTLTATQHYQIPETSLSGRIASIHSAPLMWWKVVWTI